MASLLFTVGGVVFNALAFSGTNFVFSRLMDHDEEERRRHDLAIERLQRARDEWNEDRMKRLDFINKKLREKNEARAYINNVNEAMLAYYRVFANQIKSLPPESHLSSIKGPKSGELLFAPVCTGIATYSLYEYLK